MPTVSATSATRSVSPGRFVYGHSLGSFVAMVYAIRHPRHPRALVLQSAFARFDLDRVVEEFRRAGGDEVAATVERVYGGDSASVTPEEWAACWRLFGPWVVGEQERARTIVNVELNAPGLELMRGFDVLDQLARIECPTLVCVGELDPITPVGRRPRDRRRPARGDRAARGRRGCGPLHLEGRPGSLLAAGHRFRDDHDGYETTRARLQPRCRMTRRLPDSRVHAEPQCIRLRVIAAELDQPMRIDAAVNGY